MSLDVVEAGLRQSQIKYLRFDGKVPQKERQGVIDSFRSDPTIRVMLLTLSCGAVGYVSPDVIVIERANFTHLQVDIDRSFMCVSHGTSLVGAPNCV